MIHVYCFQSTKEIVVTDRPIDQLIDKYGRRYEVLTSFASKDSASVIIPRLARNYNGFTITEWYVPEKRVGIPWTEERKAAHSLKMQGKVKSEEAKAKTSATMKGKSNFAGKRHRDESKAAIAEAKIGNDHAAGLVWCHHPVTGEEKRVETLADIPPGWIPGREYYSIETLMLNRK